MINFLALVGPVAIAMWIGIVVGWGARKRWEQNGE